jgi:hypothetical protein
MNVNVSSNQISAKIRSAAPNTAVITQIVGVITSYADNAGIATYATIAGYSTSSGIATYSTTAGVSTSVIGGISSVTQLSVSGISTLGLTTTTNLTAQQLNVTGISTIGLGNTSTPPSNSQMSFELVSNTQLRIKVRGTDGILRSANITLA